MPKLSKKNQKAVDKAIKEAREKPKRKKKVGTKKKAPAGTRIPDNVWLEDEQQGYVFIIDGMVLWLDINKESGIIKTMRTPYKEWKNDTGESASVLETSNKENKESERMVSHSKEKDKVPRSANSNKL